MFYCHTLQIDDEAVCWNAILFCNRSAAYVSLGQLKEALVDCHSALARDPEYLKAYLRRARVFRVPSHLHIL